ncbi:MAG: GxxExxY protein [Chthoniobacterales bacterium]|nr:GxxExxY protein [Chthoniobacterales bacterium]
MESEEDHALTEKVIGLAMKVHCTLGPGFLESVYLNALVYELRKAGFQIEIGQRIKVHYGNVIVGDFIADLVVAGTLICELKAISCLTKASEVQVVNYLTATNHDIGLLLNFGAESLQFKRKHRRAASAPRPPTSIPNPVNLVNPVQKTLCITPTKR